MNVYTLILLLTLLLNQSPLKLMLYKVAKQSKLSLLETLPQAKVLKLQSDLQAFKKSKQLLPEMDAPLRSRPRIAGTCRPAKIALSHERDLDNFQVILPSVCVHRTEHVAVCCFEYISPDSATVAMGCLFQCYHMVYSSS